MTNDFFTAHAGETAPPVPEGPKLCKGEDMRILHSAFLWAYPRMAELVRTTPPGDVERATFVATWLGDIDTTLHIHHEDEDLLLWDKLEQRAPACALHVGQMRAHHAQVQEILHTIDPLREQFAATADPAAGTRLAAAYDDMLEVLKVHLRREVVEIVPVAEKVITEREWAQMAERGTKAIPTSRLMPQLGLLLAAAPRQDRMIFFAAIPKPIQLMYRLFGKRQYAAQHRKLWPGVPVPETV